MSTLMVVGVITGAALMPRPIPEAIVSLVIGDVATPIRMLAAVSTHLLYGGVFGALLAGSETGTEVSSSTSSSESSTTSTESSTTVSTSTSTSSSSDSA